MKMLTQINSGDQVINNFVESAKVFTNLFGTYSEADFKNRHRKDYLLNHLILITTQTESTTNLF